MRYSLGICCQIAVKGRMTPLETTLYSESFFKSALYLVLSLVEGLHCGEYGNILKKRNCKRVINFDECFTTHVGDKTADINPTSICGQYLSEHPGLDVKKLIDAANITPARAKSRYQQK